MTGLEIDPGVRRAQCQRRLLRRREEAARDPSARTAQAEDRDPRRDRLRAGRRCAAGSQRGVNHYAEEAHGGVLLITHYTRILRYIQPQFVHVFFGGRIVESGARSWPTSSTHTDTSASPRKLSRSLT